MKEKSLNLIPNFTPMTGFLMDTFKDEGKITKKKGTCDRSKKEMKYPPKKMSLNIYVV